MRASNLNAPRSHCNKMQGSARFFGPFARFGKAEDGALLALSLFIFLAMLVVTGVAIEVMRNEERRTIIQNTADRAVLASADLSQSMLPADVARDYFAKAGLGHLQVTPVVKAGQFNEWRTVELRVSETYPTFLANLAGLKEMTARGQSTAMESVGKVEISMVLDISGSMNDKVYSGSTYLGTRMELLRSAGARFVDKMFDNVQPVGAPAGKLSISVVPYNQQVVLGSALASRFSLSTDHTQNTCVDFFKPSDFSNPAVSPTQPLQRAMYGSGFDYKQWNFSLRTYATSSGAIENCQDNTMASVLAFANNRTTLKNKINSLVAGGDTAIDMGAKWGMALLDPAAQPVVSAMISANQVSADLTGRPYSYDNVDTMKVMVLMTDGENTRSYSTKPEFRSGPTSLVTDVEYNRMYYYDPSKSTRQWFSFYSGAWENSPAFRKGRKNHTYEELWNTSKYTLQYVTETWLGRPYNNRTSVYNAMAEQSEFSQKDTNLKALCDAAKSSDRNVLIFTIAVDAPTSGNNVLKDCATSPAYHWPVTASQLDNAFAGIAASINSLRLTN